MLVGRISVNVKLARRGEGTEKHRLFHCPLFEHLLSGSQFNRGHFQCEKVGSLRSTRAGACQAEDFKGQVATGGSLLGNAGKWRAYGWAVVQLDFDEELGLLHGVYGTMDAELEVQRTIKRAELTAFLCLLRKVCGPIKDHVDDKGVIDGLRKVEKECIKPGAGDAGLWKNVGRIT